MERLKILERINVLTGEKEVIVVNSDGMKKSYKVTTVSIQRLLDEMKRVINEVKDNENIADRLKSVLIQSQEELDDVQRHMSHTQAEKEELWQKLRDLQIRFDDAM